MKYLLIIFGLLNISVSLSEDYLMDNNGKRTIVAEHYYTNKSSFRAFKVEGSFTDNLGNYGYWDAFVTTYINEGKVTKLDFSNKFTFQNKSKFYLQGFRQEGTDEGAGVGKAIIVHPDKTLKSIKNSKCVYSVKFLDDTFFGKTKCKIPKEGFKELQKVSE
tara:strand:+ start:185 stop:667 length:483 start_codon:yes stop_codon:yes gene_type:complete